MVTRKQTLPIAPGSFCLYPHPPPNHLAFIFSTSRRAHGGTQAINRSKSGGLCSFPPARSDKQNPGGSCPSSPPALASQHCSARQKVFAAQCVQTPRVPPDLDLGARRLGRHPASHSRCLGNSHSRQINNHLISGGWEHSRLLLISLPANALKSTPPAAARSLCHPLVSPQTPEDHAAGTCPVIGHVDIEPEAEEHQDHQQEEDHRPL